MIVSIVRAFLTPKLNELDYLLLGLIVGLFLGVLIGRKLLYITWKIK